jgi:hypothetical protein
MNVSQGHVISIQTPGDCKTTVCNGMGGTQEVAANDDLPADDMNPCTEPTCTAGSPGTSNTPVDTSCGGGNVCDGSGNCVQCTTSSGGMVGCAVNECLPQSCVMGACSGTPTMQGTPTSTQTAGDCQRIVCDGMGGTQSVEDNMDLPPADANECTVEGCSMGVPTHTPVGDGSPCGMDGHCVMGMCQ